MLVQPQGRHFTNFHYYYSNECLFTMFSLIFVSCHVKDVFFLTYVRISFTYNQPGLFSEQELTTEIILSRCIKLSVERVARLVSMS